MTTNRIHFIVLALALGFAACSRAEAPLESASAPAQAPGGPAKAETASHPAKADGVPTSARKVIRSAELSMQVTSPAAAEVKVSELVERLGGYIASSEHLDLDDSEPRASLSLRVPAARLDEALRELKRLSVGRQNEKLGSEDVTDDYIDVGARITNQVALEKQLTALLAQAGNVDQAIKVHHELTAVRTEIDRLQGRQRFLESETAMAKVALTLLPEPKVLAVAPVTFWERLKATASDSVDTAGKVVTSAILFAVQAAGVLLPLLLLLGTPAILLAWWLRRRQRRLLSPL
jgi:hypothetical protein